MNTTTDHLSRIDAATRDADAQFRQAVALPHGSDLEHAVRAVALARACARRVAWWGVLVRVLTFEHRGHSVHIRSAVLAECSERNDVRFWREASADWLARHEQYPTSDAAGALSNWADLGVTA